MKPTLVIDNYDSFTYNLVHCIRKQSEAPVDVYRNDQISLDEVKAYERIILSPGPGLPDEAGITKSIVKKYGPTKRILGVCLGHQAIAEIYGCNLYNMDTVLHGIETPIYLTENPDYLFKDLPKQFNGGRYHSWMVDKQSLPPELKITSVDGTGEIMSISHITHDVKGIQFHPESILTVYGELMLYNWLQSDHE